MSGLAPPERGNRRAVRHGAYSLPALEPQAQEVEKFLWSSMPWLEESDSPMVRKCALAIAREAAAQADLDRNGYTTARGQLRPMLGSISAKVTEAGGVRIEATTAGGSHGDLAFALANAMGPWSRDRRSGCAITRHGNRPLRLRHEEAHRISLGPIVETGAGIGLPQRPYLADLSPVVGAPLIHRADEEPFLAGYAHDNEGEIE